MKNIVDSSITFEEALSGKEIPEGVKNNLALIDVKHISFDGEIHQGQLIIHKDFVQEVKEIFEKILEIEFPILKVIPVVQYDWSDEHSMEDNNTSAFNYRLIYGTNRPSNHASGRALDINPAFNPHYHKDGSIRPRNGVYDLQRAGTIVADGDLVALFDKYEWEWGGRWEHKDLHHFQKLK